MAKDLTAPNTRVDRANAFVIAYMGDPERNATQAFRAAGFKGTDGAARVGAHQLLRDPRVQALIAEYEANEIANARKRAGLELDVLLREVRRGATFDARKLLDDDGNPLPLHLLDDDTASAIAGLDLVTEYDKEGNRNTVVRRYKIADRRAFVDMGLKVVGGYKKDNDQKGAAAVNAIADLLGSMKRSALPIAERVDDELV